MTAQNLHNLSAVGIRIVVDTSSGTPHIVHWGADWSHKFELTSGSASETALVFESEDVAAGIRVTRTFTVVESGVILVDSTITNIGTDGLEVEELATWLPLPDNATESLDFSGRGVNERQMFRREIQPGLWSRDIVEGARATTLRSCNLR